MFLSCQQEEEPRQKGGVRRAGPTRWEGSAGRSRAAAVRGSHGDQIGLGQEAGLQERGVPAPRQRRAGRVLDVRERRQALHSRALRRSEMNTKGEQRPLV